MKFQKRKLWLVDIYHEGQLVITEQVTAVDWAAALKRAAYIAVTVARAEVVPAYKFEESKVSFKVRNWGTPRCECEVYQGGTVCLSK